jgi:tetratricopeptide (TPR) repeat protein
VDPEIERLRKKVENYPSPSAYNRLAELLQQNNDHDGVVQVCRRCIREFKRNGKAYIILAEVYLEQGKRSDAIESLNEAITQDPRSIDALSLLADVHVSAGHPQDAITCLHKVLDLKPGDGEIEARIAKISQGPSSAPAPAGRNDSGTIDMTGMAISMTSASRTSTAPATATATAPAPAQQVSPLAALLNEAGVKGVVVSDDQGRVVSAERMANGKDTIFAAMALEVSSSCTDALQHLQHAPLASWTVATDEGVLLAFQRNPKMTLLVHASSDCKVAMVELRARQALIDLGGA